MSRSSFRVLGPIVLALVLSGCWLQLGHGSGNTRFNDLESELTDANVASLTEHWRAPIDASITEPIVSDGRVYTTTRRYGSDGSTVEMLAVQAYDRATGELVWERSLLPSSTGAGDVATPALADGALWVPYWHEGLGACAGALARLDPATGEIVSSDPIDVHPSAVVVASSTIAYMASPCSGGSQLVVRDMETRAILWTHQFAQAGVATPTIADGRLFVLQRDTLHAFDAAGCGASSCAPLWSQPANAGFFGFQRLVAGPDGALVTIADSADPDAAETIVVRDAATGAVQWEAEPRYTGSLPGKITGIALADGTVYVAGAQTAASGFGDEAILDAYPVDGCGQLVCSPTWTANLGPTRPAREPTVAGGVVYVPLVATNTVAPAVVAVGAGGCGAATCEELTRVPLVDASPPFLSGTQSYVTSVADGGVFVGLLPGLYGQTQTELIALGPSGS